MTAPELLSGFRRQVEKLGEVEWLNGPIEVAAMTPGGFPQSPRDDDLPRLLADRYRLDALVGGAASGGSTRATTPGWSGRWP